METLFPTAVSLLLLQSICVGYSAQFNIEDSQTLTIKGKANVKLDPAGSLWATLAKSMYCKHAFYKNKNYVITKFRTHVGKEIEDSLSTRSW